MFPLAPTTNIVTKAPEKQTMKVRSVPALAGLAIIFALPTYAQQKDLADPQTTQKILAIGKAIDEAILSNDPAAIAAQHTRDGVFITTEGPIIGRQAIQKWCTESTSRCISRAAPPRPTGMPFT